VILPEVWLLQAMEDLKWRERDISRERLSRSSGCGHPDGAKASGGGTPRVAGRDPFEELAVTLCDGEYHTRPMRATPSLAIWLFGSKTSAR
jgi:hypothetical protein